MRPRPEQRARDLGQIGRGRDIVLMSRPRLEGVWCRDILFGVVTWLRLGLKGTFLLSRPWVRVLFDSGGSHSFITASVVIELGLEVENLEESLYVSSTLGIRERIGMICHGCELEISGTLLTLDLRIMDMSEFDVILGMDWLIAYRVVINYERRRVTAYTQDGTRVVFQA